MGAKILIIDRDENAVHGLRTILENQGAEVLSTADGDEGLEIAQNERPGLIILDTELKSSGGYSSGFTLCKKIKRESVLSDIPVFLTSAAVSQDTFDKHSRLKWRADEYFHKPIGAEQLLSTLKKYVNISPEDSEIIEITDDLLLSEGISLDEVDLFEVSASAAPLSSPRIDLPPLPTAKVEVPDGLEPAPPSGVEPPSPVALDSLRTAPPGRVEVSGGFSPLTPMTAPPKAVAARSEERASTVLSLQSEVRRLNEILRKRDEDFATLRTTTSASEREFLALRNELNKKERQVLELKDLLFSKDSALHELTEQTRDLDARVGALQRELSESRTQLTTTENRADGLREQLGTIEQELQQSYQEALELKNKNQEILEKQKAKQEEVLALVAEVDAARAETNRLREENEATRRNFEEQLQAAQTDSRQRVEEAKQETVQLLQAAETESQHRLAALQTDFEQQIEQSRLAVEQARTEGAQALAGARQEHERALEALRSEIQNTHTAELSVVQGQLSESAATLDTVRQELADRQEELDRGIEEVQTLQSRIDELVAELDGAQRKVSERSLEMDTLTTSFSREKEALLGSHLATIAALESRLHESEQTALETQEKHNSAIAQLRQELEAVQSAASRSVEDARRERDDRIQQLEQETRERIQHTEEQARKEVEQAQKDAETQLSFAEQKLAEAKAEAEQKLAETKAEAEKQIAETRTQAEQKLAEAKTEAEKQIAEAREQTEQLLSQARQDAESMASKISAEAEARIEESRAEAGAEAERKLAEAKAEAERTLAEARAEAERQVARAQQEAESSLSRVQTEIQTQLAEARALADEQLAQVRTEADEAYKALQETYETEILEITTNLNAEKEIALNQLHQEMERLRIQAQREKLEMEQALQGQLGQAVDLIEQRTAELRRQGDQMTQLQQVIEAARTAIRQREEFIQAQSQQQGETLALVSSTRNQRDSLSTVVRQVASAHENLTKHTNRLGIILSNVLDLVKTTPRRPPEVAFTLDPQILTFDDVEIPAPLTAEFPDLQLDTEPEEAGESLEGSDESEEIELVLEEEAMPGTDTDGQQSVTTAPYSTVPEHTDLIQHLLEVDETVAPPTASGDEEESSRQPAGWSDSHPTAEVELPPEGEVFFSDDLEDYPGAETEDVELEREAEGDPPDPITNPEQSARGNRSKRKR